MLAGDQQDPDSLAEFGEEAIDLLCANELERLNERFPYRLAYNRDPVSAIREDLNRALEELGATALAPSQNYERVVKYFSPNSSRLVAVVECAVLSNNGSKVGVDLVVQGGNDGLARMYLEHVYAS